MSGSEFGPTVETAPEELKLAVHLRAWTGAPTQVDAWLQALQRRFQSLTEVA